ncbi:Uncharacterized protein OBRU01_05031 [Operophtera brumata]|uniref:Uncharacterized protein n=1 Tax=Operophtera brumata TaxID=104452 RepID=A0A0L7LMS2_OPEBR|nr:Uncharacterized protein OBRU01_05031 [Operophtera brumata]
MFFLAWISDLCNSQALLLLGHAQSYILLTAKLDDVQTIARQIARSPVLGQVNRILRRASSIFNHQARSRDDDGYQRRFSLTNSQDSDSAERIDDIIERRSYMNEEPRVTSEQSLTDEVLNERNNNSSEVDGETNQTKSSRQEEEMSPQENIYSQKEELPRQGDSRDQSKEVHVENFSEKLRNTDEVVPLGENKLSEKLGDRDEMVSPGENIFTDKLRDTVEVVSLGKNNLTDKLRDTDEVVSLGENKISEKLGDTDEMVSPAEKNLTDKLHDTDEVVSLGINNLSEKLRDTDEMVSPGEKNLGEKLLDTDEVVSLGKNASLNLDYIKQIIENV